MKKRVETKKTFEDFLKFKIKLKKQEKIKGGTGETSTSTESIVVDDIFV